MSVQAARDAMEVRLTSLRAHALMYVQEGGGDVALRDLIAHLESVCRSDELCSRALADLLSHKRLNRSSDHRVTLGDTA